MLRFFFMQVAVQGFDGSGSELRITDAEVVGQGGQRIRYDVVSHRKDVGQVELQGIGNTRRVWFDSSCMPPFGWSAVRVVFGTPDGRIVQGTRLTMREATQRSRTFVGRHPFCQQFTDSDELPAELNN